MNIYKYYRKNVRHRIRKYDGAIYVALQKKYLFFWLTIDKRKYKFSNPDMFGKIWCFEWIDNNKNGQPGHVERADHFNLYYRLDNVYKNYFL